MKLKEITPQNMLCAIGGCPAIYETDRKTVIIIGTRIDISAIPDIPPSKIADHEEAIEVPKELFFNLIK